MQTISGTPDDILDFWFGRGDHDRQVIDDRHALWFGGSPEIDREVERRFGALVAQAADGRLGSWLETARGRLAAIIVLDQLPRMIWRGRVEAFAHDAQARQWTREGIDLRHDIQLRLIERVFFYLPFEHSESIDDQRASLALYGGLTRAAPLGQRDLYAEHLKQAQRHHDVIARFGRFPQRNALLGRESTAEEIIYLGSPEANW
jgi:uncharacterized protein (DUF924 family)